MTACSARWAEDLALLAGGDLPTTAAEAEARQHAAACAACARLLEALEADQAGLGDLRSSEEQTGAGLAGSVLAALPTQAVAASASTRRRRHAWLRAAAGLVLVTATALALVQTPGERWGGETADRAVKAVSSSAETQDEALREASDLPLQVRRTAGAQLEITWDGDGREQQPYRVLASASPREFGGAQTIEVAGRRLVTTTALPSAPVAGRQVTYFVVR